MRTLAAFWAFVYVAALLGVGAEADLALVLPIFGAVFLPAGLLAIIGGGAPAGVGNYATLATVFWAVELLLHYLFVRTRLWTFLAIIALLTLTSVGGCMTLVSRLPTNPFM